MHQQNQIIHNMKRITDILKKFPQYESIPYAGDYKCPSCGNSGIANHTSRKCDLAGWCETPSGFMVVCECPECGTKFRFHPHLNKFDFDDFNETIEIHYLGEKAFSCVANSEILDKELTQANTSIH